MNNSLEEINKNALEKINEKLAEICFQVVRLNNRAYISVNHRNISIVFQAGSVVKEIRAREFREVNFEPLEKLIRTAEGRMSFEAFLNDKNSYINKSLSKRFNRIQMKLALE